MEQDLKTSGYDPLQVGERLLLEPTLGTRSYFAGTIISIENIDDGRKSKLITIKDDIRNSQNSEVIKLIYTQGKNYLTTNDGFEYAYYRKIDNPIYQDLLLRKVVLLSEKVSESYNTVEQIQKLVLEMPIENEVANGKFLHSEALQEWSRKYNEIVRFKLESLPFNMTRSGDKI